MRRMANIFFNVLLGASAPLAAQQDSGAPLPLDTAVRIAVKQNPRLASSRIDVEKADGDIALARMKRKPTFSLDVLGSQRLTAVKFAFPAASFGTYPGIGPIPATDTEIVTPRRPLVTMYATVAQPLTQLKRINLGIEANVVAADIARVKARGDAQTLATQVRQLYYAMLPLENSLRAADEAIAAAREVDRTMQQRAQEQVVLRADAATATVQLAQAEQSRLSLAHELASQKEQLNQLLGRDLRTPFMFALHSPPSDDDTLDAAASRAIEARAEVREARLRVKQAEINQRAKEAENIPDVSLAVLYSSNFNVDVLPRNLASAGVQVTWEPWDWGRRKREAEEKGRVIQQAKLNLKDAEDRVTRDVFDSARRVESTRAQLRVATVSRDAAQERLRERTKQFQSQAALSADVLQAQAQLADATAKHQQAVASYWSARADFDRSMGEEAVK